MMNNHFAKENVTIMYLLKLNNVNKKNSNVNATKSKYYLHYIFSPRQQK